MSASLIRVDIDEHEKFPGYVEVVHPREAGIDAHDIIDWYELEFLATAETRVVLCADDLDAFTRFANEILRVVGEKRRQEALAAPRGKG